MSTFILTFDVDNQLDWKNNVNSLDRKSFASNFMVAGDEEIQLLAAILARQL